MTIANGTANHIHLLVSLPGKIDVSELIGDIKRDSSVWMKKQNARFAGFYRQKGYGAFSIGQSQLKRLQIILDIIGNKLKIENYSLLAIGCSLFSDENERTANSQ